MHIKSFILKNMPSLLNQADNQQIVTRKLKQAVSYAHNSPFYKQKLTNAGINKITSIEEFKTIPMTTREELSSVSPFDLLAVKEGTKAILYGQTSGTTGHPVPSWVTLDELNENAQIAINLPVFRKYHKYDNRIAVLYPYTRTLAGRIADVMVQKMGVTLLPMGTRNNMYPPLQAAQTLERIRPNILGMVATDALSYANILYDRNIDPKSLGIDVIISGAEPCSDTKAKQIGKIFDAKVFSLLAQNEVGFVGIPCENNKLHIPSFAIYVEIFKDLEKQIPAKYGEAAHSVITPTWREAMPILRYQTDDMVRLHKEKCSCGLSLPTMDILGRKHTRIDLDSRSIFPIELEEILYRAPINGVWYQIKIDHDKIKLVVEHRSYNGNAEHIVNQISSEFEKDLGINTEVDLVPVGSLYNYQDIRIGKPVSRIIDLRKDQYIEEIEKG